MPSDDRIGCTYTGCIVCEPLCRTIRWPGPFFWNRRRFSWVCSDWFEPVRSVSQVETSTWYGSYWTIFVISAKCRTHRWRLACWALVMARAKTDSRQPPARTGDYSMSGTQFRRWFPEWPVSSPQGDVRRYGADSLPSARTFRGTRRSDTDAKIGCSATGTTQTALRNFGVRGLRF